MLLDQVRRAVKRYALLVPGDAVVIAVSGGPDSVALLHALWLLARREGWKLFAAHLNHGIRGEEADADEALVRSLGERAGVPVSVERLDRGSLGGTAIEERARRARYEFLHRVAKRVGATKIATGHTRDDQAETVLLRLLRGSATRGLGGIVPRRADGVVRPLILASRAQVLSFLRTADLPFREDRTNADPRHLRNRVRHEVLPLLLAMAPRVDEHLARLADTLRADAECLDAETQRVLQDRPTRALDAGEGEATALLDRAFLESLPEALRRRVILRVLVEAKAPSDRVSAAVTAVEDHLAGSLRDGARPGGMDLRGGRRIVWDRSSLRLEPSRAKHPPFDLPLVVPGETCLPDGSALGAEILKTPSGASLFGSAHASRGTSALGDRGKDWSRAEFDPEALKGPLRVRSRLPGDRIRPRGFGHRRKVQDLLTEARIPREARNGVPLVVMGGEVLWVAGIRESALGAPPPGAARLLILRYLPASDWSPLRDERS